MSIPRSPHDAKQEQELMATLWDPAIKDDPLAFVMACFPWGKANTPLERFTGPRSWQKDELQAIRDHIRSNQIRMSKGEPPIVYQSATASGRGIGKSSLTSWLVLWLLSTRLGSTVVVTANTEAQLKSRTWAELGKWHTLAINKHWFERSALSLKPEAWFEHALTHQLKIDTGYHYAQAQLWSEEKPDAFAGVHNPHGILVLFDEASGIPKPIWTVTEGFFTEPEPDRYWLAFSNPRRNTGEFFECFHANRDHWNRRNIDSRTVEGTDKGYLESIVRKHGADSDAARIEVLGQFPRQGDRQFISRDIIENAIQREITDDQGAPIIMGVDPARYGDDKTVVRFRQGRNGRVIPPVKLKGADNMAVADECAFLIGKYNPDAVCIDAGNGTGIIDRLRQLGYKVHEVWFGSKSEDQEWANKRTELWARMRDWLGGAAIDNDQDLKDDLAGPEYKFMGTSDRLMLESKEEMKRRGLHSPDDADALACTFAVKVARRDLRASRLGSSPSRNRMARGGDYSLFD